MALDSDDLPHDFGPYTLQRRIAVGGMAEVYVATTKGVGGFEKLVALKVIHPRFSEDEHFTQMLVEEAKIAVLLTHVNVAQTFDLGCIEDTYYIAMELIEGADAYRVMRKCAELKKAIPIDVATFVVAEMCNGLDYAHRKRDPNTGKPLGIVHRDISPQNVLISFAGEVKIVDFGIAKAASRSTQTEVGVIKGKYYYMSPEQAWGDPMDHRSDVFSTGVVLYELLTGRMLYQDNDVPTLLDKVRKAEIARPETRRPSIPRELSDIVMKALAKEPGDRFQSAGEMGQALHQFLYSASPTFSAVRIAELVSLLFPSEAPRSGPASAPPEPAGPVTVAPKGKKSPSGELPAKPLPKPAVLPKSEGLPKSAPLPKAPPASPPAKLGFDLGDDEDDEATRNDVLPFRRAKAQREASAPMVASPSVTDQRVQVPEVGPGGAWVAPVASDPNVRRDPSTDARRLAWDDDTDNQDADEFSDSTQVDTGGLRAVAAGLMPGRDASATRPLDAKASLAFDTDDTTNELKHVAPRKAPSAVAPAAPPAMAPRPPAPRTSAAPSQPQAELGRVSYPVDPFQGAPSAAPYGYPAGHPSAPPASGYPFQSAPAPVQPPAAWPPTAPPSMSMPPNAPPMQGAMGQGAMGQGAMGQGSMGQGSMGQGSMGQGSMGQGAMGQGAMGQGMAPLGQPGYGASPGFAPPPVDPFASPVSSGPVPVATELGKPQPLRWIVAGLALAVLAVAAGLVVYLFFPNAPPPAFEIESLPPGAQVSFDGRVLPGATPLAIREGLEVGRSYSVEVSLEGHESAAFQLQAGHGTMRREVVLRALPATLHVETDPVGAQVTVSGASRGAAPVDVGGLSVGADVEVRVDAPGRQPVVQRVHITAPRSEVRVTLTSTP